MRRKFRFVAYDTALFWKGIKMRIVVLCIGAILLLGACSTGKSFYLGNAVTEYTEEDDMYWTLVNFGNANVRELVRKNKVGVTPKKGTPKFKGGSDYDLSQFNFVEARRHHGQRVMIQRFRAIRLQKTMRIEALRTQSMSLRQIKDGFIIRLNFAMVSM